MNFIGTGSKCPNVDFPLGQLPQLSCYSATVSCPNTTDIGIYFAYATPPGSQGTIVIFTGSGGTTAYGGEPPNESYAASYYSGNNGSGKAYEVVLTAWFDDWEDTNTGPAQIYPYNIQTAACRAATFLNYVRYQNALLYTANTGMCAHGSSGGAGAVAYSLAWYGAANYLDKVELLAGPTFSDIEQGCEVPNGPAVTICPLGQFGCQGWPPYTVVESPEYVKGAQNDVGAWTGYPRFCNGQNNTSSEDGPWLQQSIVETVTGQPSFNYPNTAMSGWLCASSQTVGSYNSSSPQGEIFLQQFTQPSQLWPGNYDVYAVYQCFQDEGVAFGTVPYLQGSPSGFNAIVDDMIGQLNTVACSKNVNH